MHNQILRFVLGLFIVLGIHSYRWQGLIRRSYSLHTKRFLANDNTIVSPFDTNNKVPIAFLPPNLVSLTYFAYLH